MKKILKHEFNETDGFDNELVGTLKKLRNELEEHEHTRLERVKSNDLNDHLEYINKYLEKNKNSNDHENPKSRKLKKGKKIFSMNSCPIFLLVKSLMQRCYFLIT